jgi:hypothetical protein
MRGRLNARQGESSHVLPERPAGTLYHVRSPLRSLGLRSLSLVYRRCSPSIAS